MKRMVLFVGIMLLAISFTGCKKTVTVVSETEPDGIIQETDVPNLEPDVLLIETEAEEVYVDNGEILIEDEMVEIIEDGEVVLEEEEN